MHHDAAHLPHHGILRLHGPASAATNHPEERRRALLIPLVHQTVRRRQHGPIVHQTTPAKVSTAEAALIRRAVPNRDLMPGGSRQRRKATNDPRLRVNVQRARYRERYQREKARYRLIHDTDCYVPGPGIDCEAGVLEVVIEAPKNFE